MQLAVTRWSCTSIVALAAAAILAIRPARRVMVSFLTIAIRVGATPPNARFARLSPLVRRSFAAARTGSFAARDAIGPLWKHTAGNVAEAATLIAACRKLWPHLDGTAIKAALVVHCADETGDELLSSLHDARLAQLAAIPRLPEHRREVLLRQAADAESANRAALAAIRTELLRHRRGMRILCTAARSCYPASNAAEPSPTPRAISEAASSRGQAHERRVISWARDRWPCSRYEVLGNAYVLGEPGVAPVAGVKAEFDALILSRHTPPHLVAIVEAKAGAALYDDLPKLLRARAVTLCAGGTVAAREGKCGAVREVAVPRAPELCYVFGTGTSLEQIAHLSFEMKMNHALLESAVAAGAAAGDAGSRLEVEGRGSGGRERSARSGGCGVVMRVHATYPPERVSALQADADAFAAQLAQLAESGEVSFWASTA
jgi:hypothetical protein